MLVTSGNRKRWLPDQSSENSKFVLVCILCFLLHQQRKQMWRVCKNIQILLLNWELSYLTYGLQIRGMSRVAQGHRHLTKEHCWEFRIWSKWWYYFQTTKKRKRRNGEIKRHWEFYCFCQQPREAQWYRTVTGTSLIQHWKGKDSKFKFHVVESVWRNLKIKWYNWTDYQKTQNKTKNIIWDGLQLWNPHTHITQFHYHSFHSFYMLARKLNLNCCNLCLSIEIWLCCTWRGIWFLLVTFTFVRQC